MRTGYFYKVNTPTLLEIIRDSEYREASRLPAKEVEDLLDWSGWHLISPLPWRHGEHGFTRCQLLMKFEDDMEPKVCYMDVHRSMDEKVELVLTDEQMQSAFKRMCEST